jgi:hypothetical protein
MRNAFSYGFSLTLSLGLLACGGGGGSPAGPSGPDYSGSWRGTSDNDPVSFSVSGGRIDNVSAEYTAIYLKSAGRGAVIAVLCQLKLQSSGPVAISGNTFSVPVGQGDVANTTFRGSFSSERSASGTIDAFVMSRGCGGDTILAGADQDPKSWSATKQ